jgi:hypothetical protein
MQSHEKQSSTMKPGARLPHSHSLCERYAQERFALAVEMTGCGQLSAGNAREYLTTAFGKRAQL